MSDPVNGPPITGLLELVLLQLRGELHALSAQRFPGLRARHYRLLSFLPPEGERVSRLVVRSGLTKQALAQALAPLEEAGFVEVLPDPDDRRARLVRLTDGGHEVVRALSARLAEVEAGWARSVGAQRWATARAVLAEVAVLPSSS